MKHAYVFVYGYYFSTLKQKNIQQIIINIINIVISSQREYIQ